MSSPEALSLLEPVATQIREPVSGRSVWLAGMLREASLEEGLLRYTLLFSSQHSAQARQDIRKAMESGLREQGWEGEILCNVRLEAGGASPPAAPSAPVRGMSAPPGSVQPHGGPVQKQPIPGVRHVIAVGSGKGGVGKSTVATNIACGLSAAGFRVGLMDADIYGPSLPTMMHVKGNPVANRAGRMLPLQSYGVRCMSIGFLAPETEAIIWRGPMVMGVVRQFLQQVAWGELDYLIVDLPPGTGDAQLTMIQATPISGAVLVTTPQEIALLDARRGVEMFRKLQVPILGVVENMSWLELPGGDRMHPFGKDGGAEMASAYQVPLLAQIPLDPRIREGGDQGSPAVLGEDADASIFRSLCERIAQACPP